MTMDRESIVVAVALERKPVTDEPLHPSNLLSSDVNDTFMTFVFQYMEHCEKDLQWSFCSDGLFILGGVLYMALSIWEALAAPAKVENYYSLNALAPLVYLFNSLVDLQWAQQIRLREKSKKAIVEEWNSYRSMPTHSNASTTASASQPSTLVWHQRLRKHAAHRRSILAASTFGIAALLALVAVLLPPDQHVWTGALNVGSDHIYVVSALFATTGRRTRPWLRVTSETTDNKSHPVLRVWADPEILEDLGDFFFLIGSLMDSVLDDVRVSAHSETWAIVSSLLWLIDACLYLRSDFVMAGRVKKSHDVRSDSIFV